MSKRKIIVITGPTATGKSALALGMAQGFGQAHKDISGGVIINADSMQIYRDLQVITARPSDEEMAQASHELYGVLDGAVNCNAAMWCSMAKEAIENAWDNGQQPILVGGTGMYLMSLKNGLSYVPEIDKNLRESLRKKLHDIGNAEFHAYLRSIDPLAADKLEVNDSLRILRAAEIMLQTGKPISYWQEKPLHPVFEGEEVEFEFNIMQMERERLYERINQRFDKMVELGAIDEVAEFKARKLDPTLPLMRAHGVPEFIAYLDGKMTLEDAIDKAKQHTRNYAKRQMTWARGQLPDDSKIISC